MKTVQNLEKYTAYRRTLAEEDSGSDDYQIEQIPKLMCELIPAYYQYRRYLVDILKQANVHSSLVAQYSYPKEHYEQKIQRCEKEKKLNQTSIKQKGSSRLTRTLVTQKIIQRKRKQLQQQTQLLRKYEAQQIQDLMGTNFSQKQLLPRFQQRVAEQPTFQVKNMRRLSSIDYRIQQDKAIEDARNNGGSPSKQVMQVKINKQQKRVENSVLPSNRNGRKQRQMQAATPPLAKKNKTQSDLSNSVNQSKVIEKSRNYNLKLGDTDSIFSNQDRQKSKIPKVSQNKGYLKVKNNQEKPSQRQISKQKLNKSMNEQMKDITSVPKIRINYQDQKQQLYADDADDAEDNSQNDEDFLDVQQNKIINNANIVEVDRENDDTYSQYKVKPYLRQNTPNFDAFSQQARPKNFFQAQRQRLQKQKQQAELLNNQVSIMLGESIQQSSCNSRQIIRKSNQNFVLDQALINDLEYKEVRTGLLSPRQSIQYFLSSIRFILCQLCDLHSHSQCHKYLLKNKQYQILMNLSSQQVGKGPIFANVLTKKTQALLKDQQKSHVSVVINKIFNQHNYISFQDFGEAFSTNLTKNEYNILISMFTKINPLETMELLGKLFSVWLQINYFQNKVRKLFHSNSSQIHALNPKFTSDGQLLNYEVLEKFIYTTTHNRVNYLKIQLFFSKIIPGNTFTQMISWLQKKSSK